MKSSSRQSSGITDLGPVVICIWDFYPKTITLFSNDYQLCCFQQANYQSPIPKGTLCFQGLIYFKIMY